MKTELLEQLPALSSGAHSSFEEGICIMEAVAYVAGEPWSDSPVCACPVMSSFLRVWNDDLNDEDRQMLKPLIPRLVNSLASPEIENQRREMISDWYFKVHVPTWLEMAGLNTHAQDARENGINADWSATWSAAAAWSAAASAAAAWSAAASATWSATWSAAAAASAARSAAAAASAAASSLRPNVVKLQKSALELIDRCLELK